MSKGYLIGVDIGTSESKGVLTTLEGQILNTQTRPHTLSIPKPGWAEHDAESIWWGEFCSITRELIKETGVSPKEILGVGCSSIGPDMLPVDENCKALRPAVLYGIDTRATEEIKELEEKYGKEVIFDRCANALSSQAVGPKILWLKHNEPDIYNKAYKFVTGTTFIVAKLTGKYVIDHYSASTFVPLYDFKNNCWDQKFCEGIVEIERLPEIAWSTDIAGTVTKEAAEHTGLAEGTPVTVGTIDASAEAVSVGVVSPGQMMLMYGSTMFLIKVSNKPVKDARLWAAPYLFPGTYAVKGGMATTGSLTRWFRDNFAKDILEVQEKTGENAYGILADQVADIAPGSEGLVALPYFSGERTPLNDPKAKGVIFGLTLAHSRAHVYRALLEGVGYGINQHIDILDAIGAKPDRIFAVGGGTKNKEWLQIVTDICNTEQHVPSVTFGASYGDAFLAGLGIGKFESQEDIYKWIKDIKVVKPKVDNHNIYKKYQEIYNNLYIQTKDLMHTI